MNNDNYRGSKNKRTELFINNTKWIVMLITRCVILYFDFSCYYWAKKNNINIGIIFSLICIIYNYFMISYESQEGHETLFQHIKKNNKNTILLIIVFITIIVVNMLEFIIFNLDIYYSKIFPSALTPFIFINMVDYFLYILLGFEYMAPIFFALVFIGNYIDAEKYGVIFTILTLLISIINGDELKNLMQNEKKVKKHELIKASIQVIIFLSFIYISVLVSDYIRINQPNTYLNSELYLKIKTMTGPLTPIYFRSFLVIVMYIIYFLCEKIFGSSIKDYIEKKFFYM